MILKCWKQHHCHWKLCRNPLPDPRGGFRPLEQSSKNDKNCRKKLQKRKPAKVLDAKLSRKLISNPRGGFGELEAAKTQKMTKNGQ